MKTAVVSKKGVKPVYGDFEQPVAREGHCIVNVDTSALSQLARMKALGKHYSSTDTYPFVAGVDGVGRLENGKRVYFFGASAPFGAMVEQTLVPRTQCIAIADSLDDVSAATIAIPGMSSWAALTERARFVEGEPVWINGATGHRAGSRCRSRGDSARARSSRQGATRPCSIRCMRTSASC